MTMIKKKHLVSLLLDLFVFVSVFVCVIIRLIIPQRNVDGNVVTSSPFQYFTIDSNVLIAISSLINVIIILLKRKADDINYPTFASKLNFISTCSTTLTFLTVLLILAPFTGFWFLYKDVNLFLHFLSPVAKFINYLFFQKDNKQKFIDILYAIIPILIYGIIYFIMVIVVGKENGGWYDFYGFKKNLGVAANSVVMAILSIIIVFGLYYLKRHYQSKKALK